METLVICRPNVDRQNAKKKKKKKKKRLKNVYDSWDDKFRVTRENFNFILNRIQSYVEKAPILPSPIESDRQY